MKKILVLLAIGIISSTAMGTIAFTTAVTEVNPSDTIMIYLNSDVTNVVGLYFDVVADNGGTFSDPGTITWDVGYEGFAAGNVVSYVGCSSTGVPPAMKGGNLWWASFHVPDLPASSNIVISAEMYGGYDTPYVDILVGSVIEKILPGDLVLHVIPEPMTMGLLAIGGLVALRRRRA